VSPALVLDTSVAVPLLVRTHVVLTRLPGDLRVAPADAARLLEQRFSPPLLLGWETAGRLPEVLSRMEIAGGAVYDALVALAAVEQSVPLATRDARARNTYERVGAVVVIAG
jgi:hypothetical protein